MAMICVYLNFSLPAGEVFISAGTPFVIMNIHMARAMITRTISGTRANRGPKIKREKNNTQDVMPRPRPVPRDILSRKAPLFLRGKKI
jgi:hypothetical protein